MKKITLILLLFAFISQYAQAQSVPLGMKYQAVARDNSGEILSDKKISLQINLVAHGKEKVTTYTETHDVVTNVLGLFSLNIGEGDVNKGAFKDVPWSTDDIWMEIKIQENEEAEFVTISNSKMLSVPYAFHAATAGELRGKGALRGDDGPGNSPGVPSQNWSLFGNSTSDPTIDKLGTTDLADLVIVTNNIERMRILEDGDIEIVNSLDIGKDLTVQENVYLNTSSGQTINNGPFTVTNQSPTLLSGTLTVDLATDLNSSLNVDGVTDLNSALNVNNGSPTLLTGTLLVNDNATFNQQVLVDNAALGSSSTSTGGLVVAGGVGIGQNLYVGGTATFEGTVDFQKPVTISAPDESTSTTNGALIVAGGVGIGKRLNLGGAADLGSSLTVAGLTTLNNNLNVSNAAGGGHVASFENTSNGNGISIKVGHPTPTNSNNFITFLNSNNGTVGRIEGEWTQSDLNNNREYQDDLNFMEEGKDIALAAEIAAGVQLGQAVAETVAAATSSTACVGFGACVTTPILSFIFSTGLNLVIATADFAIAAADAIILEDNYYDFIDTHIALLGITFASGSEDYAEYLPKLNPDEKFMPGDIVGVKNGVVSKKTSGADKIMVVSLKPVVAGGLPQDEDVSGHVLVAFMGQVPTKVFGQVNPGDYILPGGYHNGFGVAKSPELMRPQDYKKVLGVAWEGNQENGTAYVNTAIGLNTNDLADIVQQQDTKIKQLESQMTRTNAILADLVPGFAEKANISTSHDGHDHPAQEEAQQPIHAKDLFVEPTADQIVYIEIEKGQLEASFAYAKKITKEAYEKHGLSLNDHPFWKRIDAEAGYKDEVLEKIAADLTKTAHVHQDIYGKIIEKK